MNALKRLLYPDDLPKKFGRLVYLTNLLACIMGILTLGLLGILMFLFGYTLTTGYVLLVAILFFTVPIINEYYSYHVGRIFFCSIPVWLTMFITVYSKIAGPHFTYIVYFDSRYILLATAVLPGLVFRLEERKQFLFCLVPIFVFIIFFDPIHELFGVGFFQRGFSAYSYYYINYIVIISFLILLFGIFLLRSVMERAQRELEIRNRELQDKQYEVEAQHEELLQQQEELITSREVIEQANITITEQQRKLEIYNASLEQQVNEKNKDLQHTNQELVKHNNELVQFSYTVSHNLRGPVARLLGLSQLLRDASSNEERKQMEELILNSSVELDEILHDLSIIIDIRNEIYRVREKIVLEEEWKKAIGLLSGNIKPEYSIDVDFSDAPYMYGIRPMVQSIFYNLVSNAIKYQYPNRDLRVKVKSYPISSSKTAIEVSDNGLGIDIPRHGDKLFKLYKRLHTHVSGKGLGLFLVKTQAEAMGGEIEVKSTLGIGSTFLIVFTHPEAVGRQVFFESEAAQLYYDANANITVVVWKDNVTSKGYRQTWEAVLDSLKIHSIKSWIADQRKQGPVADEDFQWFLSNIVMEGIKLGLKRVASINRAIGVPNNYFPRLKIMEVNLPIDVSIFHSMEEATEWILKENQKKE